MGKIVHFTNDDNIAGKIGRRRKLRKIGQALGIISAICGILGVSVFGIIKMTTQKDWQAIVELYNNKGLELFDSGNYEQAIELFDEAIKLEPKGIKDIETCYFNRGRAYHKLGDYQRAIGDYTKAIELNPKSKYYSTRATAYEEIGDIANATLDNLRVLTTMTE